MLKPYLFSFEFEEQLYVASPPYTYLAFIFADSKIELEEIESYCLTQVSLFEQRNVDYYAKILSHELKNVHQNLLSEDGFRVFFEEDVRRFRDKGVFRGTLHSENNDLETIELLVEQEDDFPTTLKDFPNYKLGNIGWLRGFPFVFLGENIGWD